MQECIANMAGKAKIYSARSLGKFVLINIREPQTKGGPTIQDELSTNNKIFSGGPQRIRHHNKLRKI